MNLGERHVDARHVADAERDGDGVEALVGQRQRLGVGFDERDVVPRLRRALAADREHLGVDVGDGDAGAGPGPLGDAEGDVAGAAGEVEDVERPCSPFGGLTAVTSASFQARCRPPDIRSFIRS